MADLNGNTIASTYSGLLKTSDNGTRGAEGSADQISDGRGNNTPLYLSATEVYAVGSGGGTSNTAFGKGSGVDLASGGNYNTFFGEDAGATNKLGDNNIAIGYDAFDLSYIDDTQDALTVDNIFIGKDAGGGDWATAASHSNVGIGSGVMDAAMNGALNNVAVGYAALGALTTGGDNIAIGANALQLLTTGGQNVAIGRLAFDAADGTESENVAIGHAAMGAIDEGGGAADANVCIGYNAGAGGATTEFSSNVAIGAYAFDGSSTQLISNVVAIGKHALGGAIENEGAGTVAIGASALTALTTGSGNTAIGYQAATAVVAGERNTVVGHQAYSTSSHADGDNNTVMGYLAGADLTEGAKNTVIGSLACNTGSNDLTTGDENIVIGYGAGVSAVGATNQIVIGTSAVGQADNSVTLGNDSVTDVYMASDKGAKVWCRELDVASSSTGDLCVIKSTDSGAGAGPHLIIERESATPQNNDNIGQIIFRGRGAGVEDIDYMTIKTYIDEPTDDDEKTIFEIYSYAAGSAGIAFAKNHLGNIGIRVSANNTNAITMGGTTAPSTDNSYDLGHSSYRWDDVYATNGTIDTSDERKKDEISDSSLGLDFIKKLRPVEFKWKDYDYESPVDYYQGGDEIPEGKHIGDIKTTEKKSKSFSRKHYGLIAQEVEEVLNNSGISTNDFAPLIYDESADLYGMRYSEMVSILMKSVQELSAKVEALEDAQ